MNEDNKRLGYIEGGVFESMRYGDDRDAVIAHIKVHDSFKLSSRAVIILEVEEWDDIKARIRKC